MRQNIWRQFDYVLFFVTGLLVIIGVLMISSATRDAIDPDLINRVPDQIRYGVIGMILMGLLAFIDYRLLGGIANWLYAAMLVLLVMVFFFGVEGDGGARSWINLGIRIQPAEIAKVVIIITLGQFLTQNYERMGQFATIVRSLVHLAVPTALVFIQPDLGMTIVFLVLWFTLVWAAGIRWRHLGILALIGVMAIPVAWANMEDYQRERITTFISPSPDDASYYNLRQALISTGSGGLLGKGYMQGSQTQLRFLRVRHTDFIFSVICEEFGLVGGLTVMVLIGVVIMRVLRAAQHASDPLGSFICYGIASFIFFQTVVSIGMNIGVMPITGLTLPFVSSGGTSLLSTLIALGLVQSVIVRRRRV
jgi:rod shape determining protein RodA